MTLKTARTKLRLTEIESLTQTGRTRTREAANEAGARIRDSGSGRSASGPRITRSAGWSSAKEGDAMPYRDSGSDPTIGQELSQAREAAGLELADVAAQLRIRQEFLAALEEGRPNVLPGTTYAIGYVRTYAAFLGLDVEQAVTRFKKEAAGLDQRTQLVFPSPAPEGRVPGVGLMFASVLLAGLAYGGWYWLSERGMSVYDMVPDVPERLATLIEGQNPPTTLPAPATGVPATTTSAQSSLGQSSVGQSTTAADTPSETAPSDLAPQGQAPQTTASVAPDSTYTAANPTSVPVTARSSSGETAAPALAPIIDPAPSTTAATSAITRPTTDAPAASSAPVAPVTVTPAPAPNAMTTVEVGEGSSAPDPEPGTTTLAAAAPAPTQALAAAQPLAAAPSPTSGFSQSSPVPSAPRLSGLIGASEAAVPGAAGNPVPAATERVLVRATGESWVQVRAGDGTTLFTRVLRNGDVYRVPDRPGLTLATGNAGALEILVDGDPAPSLGTFGEVVRNIALDPSRLAAGTAIAGRN